MDRATLKNEIESLYANITPDDERVTGFADPLSLLVDVKVKSMIDFGCGGGFDCKRFAEQSSGLVVGLDIQPRMISYSKAGDSSGVQFIEADMRKSGYPDNYFDCVISNCSLSHIEDKVEVIKEMMRVLKKGGQFAISDLTRKETFDGMYYISSEQYRDIFKDFPYLKHTDVPWVEEREDGYRVVTFYGIK